MIRFSQPFLQLPKSFCAETLTAEVRALPDSAWVPHPGNYAGNDAVLLITPEGRLTNGFTGPMAPTEHLLKCPYIMEIMSELGAVWTRSRLMGLAPGAMVPPHVDVNYHWRTHIRIHIPVITTPSVLFTCGGDTVHMAAGECWIFDSFRMHHVHNGGTDKRVHLVLDTVGGEGLWDLIEQAQSATDLTINPKFCRPGDNRTDNLAFEQINRPQIMSPWEIQCHLAFLAEHAVPDSRLEPVLRRLDKFAHEWTAAWAQFGEANPGIPVYQRLITSCQRDVEAMGAKDLQLRNQVPVALALTELIFRIAVPQTQSNRAPLRPSVSPATSPRRLAS